MASANAPDGMREWHGRYSQTWVAATLAHWGTVCHLCRQPGADTADHLQPRSRGGADSLANLRPAHHGCNSARGAMTMAEWHATHPVPRAAAPAPSRDWFL